MQTYKLSILFLFFIAINLHGQNALILSHNYTDIGMNLTLGIERKIKRHAIFIAAKYHINNLTTDDQNNVYRKRFYAINPLENFLGARLYYRYDIRRENKIFYPFYFFDTQITHAHIRDNDFLPFIFDMYGNVLYEKDIHIEGPFTPLELNTGIGFEITLNSRFSYYQQFGGGVNFIFGKDRNMPATLYKLQWEFCNLLSSSIAYKFGNNAKDKKQR